LADPSLRFLSRPLEPNENASGILSVLEDLGDRELAVVGGALLEDAVRKLVIANLTVASGKHVGPFLSENGQLGTPSAQTTLLYALGIISERLRINLDAIRSIRNTFGHTPRAISFDNPAVAARCKQLNMDAIVEDEFAEWRAARFGPKDVFLSFKRPAVEGRRAALWIIDKEKYGWSIDGCVGQVAIALSRDRPSRDYFIWSIRLAWLIVDFHTIYPMLTAHYPQPSSRDR